MDGFLAPGGASSLTWFYQASHRQAGEARDGRCGTARLHRAAAGTPKPNLAPPVPQVPAVLEGTRDAAPKLYVSTLEVRALGAA